MGAKVEKYIDKKQDILEDGIKDNKSLNEILKNTHCNNDDILEIISEPNKWNAIHIACWYNNVNILNELKNCSNFNKYIDAPDNNGEPPIAICCVVDAIDCLNVLIESGAKQTFTDSKYRKYLDLCEICCYHNSPQCFQKLNPELKEKSEQIGEDNEPIDYRNTAILSVSDKIRYLLEEYKDIKELGSYCGKLNEEISIPGYDVNNNTDI